MDERLSTVFLKPSELSDEPPNMSFLEGLGYEDEPIEEEEEGEKDIEMGEKEVEDEDSSLLNMR